MSSRSAGRPPNAAAKVPYDSKQPLLAFGHGVAIIPPGASVSPNPTAAGKPNEKPLALPPAMVTALAANAPPSLLVEAPKPKPEEVRKTTIHVSLQLRPLHGISGVVATTSVKRIKLEVDGLKVKRARYTPAQKQMIIKASEASSSLGKAAELARNTPGFETVDKGMLSRWKQHGPPKKVGRGVNADFEAMVLSHLVYTQLQKVETQQQVLVLANVAYSYALVKVAAEFVQRTTSFGFSEDKKVQALKFANTWIVGFLERNGLRRRRITSTTKVLPPAAEVAAHMKVIQKRIVDGEHTLDEVCNADETGVCYGAPPKNQYVPISAERASAPESDDKARFTMMLFGTSEGVMGPTFNILKCTVNKVDLSSTRVLTNLMQEAGYREVDGWKMMRWQRTLTLKGKNKQMVTRNYVRPYLIHNVSRDVVTLQHKAWMDSAGVAMWFDTVLGPFYAAKRKKALLIWDNCGPHGVDAIVKVAAEWGIDLAPLPPKMTDSLQVMDLVVNQPLKAAIRRARCGSLFNYFQNWRLKRLAELAKPVDKREPLPDFNPPKPKLAEGLYTALGVCNLRFKEADFITSVRKSFVESCYGKREDGTFLEYRSHRHGKVNKHLMLHSEEPPLGTFGEVTSQVLLETRSEVMADEGEEEEDGEEDDEEEGEMAALAAPE